MDEAMALQRQTPNPDNEERQDLRRQLRQAGWNVGAMRRTRTGVELALWPVPYTGPSEGIAARHVPGADKTEALRNALATAAEVPAPHEAP